MPREWEQYIKDEEAANTPSDSDLLGQLDAYDHLNWTVGDDDWLACFDAIRYDDRIAYHVVVDCESGGFIDTIESKVVPATPEGVRDLLNLAGYWAGIYREQNPTPSGYGRLHWRKTDKAWRKYIAELLASEN